MSTEREKTGVFIGAYAINPMTNERIPIWIADYVLPGYGTGAIMAVPAHDERDFEFARKFEPADPYVVGARGRIGPRHRGARRPHRRRGAGRLRRVHRHAGLRGDRRDHEGARGARAGPVRGHVPPARLGCRPPALLGRADPDRVLRRARAQPVPEDQLPVVLPTDVDFAPTGVSPLQTTRSGLTVECPECGGAGAARDRHDGHVHGLDLVLPPLLLAAPIRSAPFDRAECDRWMPIDLYTGGAEHAVMHLLYYRFFVKALRDLGTCRSTSPR